MASRRWRLCGAGGSRGSIVGDETSPAPSAFRQALHFSGQSRPSGDQVEVAAGDPSECHRPGGGPSGRGRRNRRQEGPGSHQFTPDLKRQIFFLCALPFTEITLVRPTSGGRIAVWSRRFLRQRAGKNKGGSGSSIWGFQAACSKRRLAMVCRLILERLLRLKAGLGERLKGIQLGVAELLELLPILRAT
jgi:hypothetical protein